VASREDSPAFRRNTSVFTIINELWNYVTHGHGGLRPSSRVARWPVFHRPGWYFTANVAEGGKRPVF